MADKIMSSSRKTIGRTFSQSHIADTDAEPNFTQKFVLASGKTVVFTLMYISADELQDRTYVQQEINGRDQSALTADSLVDITRTIHIQQFFPAIGMITAKGIEILDGSRRRAGALLRNVGLNILVTEASISASDARQLAADIQTAKEHNLRETGLRLLALKKSGLSQKEIAEKEHLSEAKVTRAIQAAQVPQQFMDLFPVQSELTYPDYQVLLKTTKLLDKNNIPLDEFISNIEDSFKTVDITGLASDEIKLLIINKIKSESSNSKHHEDDKTAVTYLWSFVEKDKFARKKTKGRMLSYEFNRMPVQLQDILDETINDVIIKYFEK